MTITISFVPFQNIYQGSQDIKACILSPHLRALSQTSSCLLRPMHFSFLAVLVALTTFMYVSATPSVFSRSCRAVGKNCQQGSDCCSDACAYTSDCSAKTCVDDSSILIGELARREIDCWVDQYDHGPRTGLAASWIPFNRTRSIYIRIYLTHDHFSIPISFAFPFRSVSVHTLNK